MAATTYRLAKITGDSSQVPKADKAFAYIQTQIRQDDGLLLNVVDPLNWGQMGNESPEGQSFVLLLQAAWRDFNNE